MSKKLESMTKKELIGRVNIITNKIDGWSNVFTGMGEMNKDKRTGGYFAKTGRKQRDELTNLYVYDGLSKRVIDIKVHDMVKNKYKITNDLDDVIITASKDLKFLRNVEEALTWQDVYGGSIILMGIDDGQEFDEPVNEDKIKSIDFLKVYDRNQINISETNLYDDPKEKKFGEPEIYPISPDGGGNPFEVHESRVLRFDGVLLPDIEKISNEYWGDSLYQGYYASLQGMGNTYRNIETIIEEFIIGVLKIGNLENLIQTKQGDDLLQRLNYMDMAKHIINSILLDKEEEFERISATVSGIEQLIDKLESGLSAITGIPVSRLFGQSPKGLNASGQESSQMEMYYDMIKARQEEKMLDQIERFNYILMLSKEGPTHGKIEEDWKIEFIPLHQPTPKEDAETKKIEAETAQIYIVQGVLFPGEVAKSRFSGITYSSEITLSDSHEALIDSEDKEIKEAAKNGAFKIGDPKDPKDSENPDNPKDKEKEKEKKISKKKEGK